MGEAPRGDTPGGGEGADPGCWAPHSAPLPSASCVWSLSAYLGGLNRPDWTSERVYPQSHGGEWGTQEGCRGRETTDNQEAGMEPQAHGPWRPVPLGPSLLQAPVPCSGHCPSQGPESPPSLQPAGDGHSHSWPVAGFSEGQGCDMESRQRGRCTRLAGTLAQRPRAGRPGGAGVRPLRPPRSPGRSRRGRGGTPPLSVTDS